MASSDFSRTRGGDGYVFLSASGVSSLREIDIVVFQGVGSSDLRWRNDVLLLVLFVLLVGSLR